MNLAGLYKSGSFPLNTVPRSPWAHAICLTQTERRTAVMEEHMHFSHAVTYYCPANTILGLLSHLLSHSVPLAFSFGRKVFV